MKATALRYAQIDACTMKDGSGDKPGVVLRLFIADPSGMGRLAIQPLVLEASEAVSLGQLLLNRGMEGLGTQSSPSGPSN